MPNGPPDEDWLGGFCFFTAIAVAAYAILFFKDWMAKRERRGAPPLISARMVTAITTVIVILFVLVAGFFLVLALLGLFTYRT